MKPESLKELQDAVTALSMKDLTPEEFENVQKSAIDHIKAAICIETPAPKGTFNPYDYVADDKVRIALNGVYHSEGFRVATDSHILVAIKGTYEEEKEGKIIGKDGREIMARYPKWRAVIPEDNRFEHTDHKLDTAKVYDLVKRAKAENKLAGRYGVKKMGVVKVGDTFFNAEKLAQLCRFLDHYGTTDVLTFGGRPMKATAHDGSVCILMPVMSYGDNWGSDDSRYLRVEFE